MVASNHPGPRYWSTDHQPLNSLFLKVFDKVIRGPFFFLIVMEGLNIALKSAFEKSLFQGIKFPKEAPTISYLFYADNAIFVGKCSSFNLKNLIRVQTVSKSYQV